MPEVTIESGVKWIELIGVIIYMGILLLIGVLASRKMKDMRDYFAAGKQLSFWSVAFSARATGESGWLLLGLTGMGAAVGVHAFWVVIGEVLGVAIAWLWMCKRFKRLTDRYDSITIPDYLTARFPANTQRLRMVAAFTLCAFVTIYVAAQIHATGKAFHEFLDISYWYGAILGFGVVLLYSTSGGFLAVAWSDVFQGVLMFLGLVLLPLLAWHHLGDLSALSEGLNQNHPDLLSWAGKGGEWTLMNGMSAIGFVLIGVGFLGSPQIFVRFLALKDEREIPKGAAVAITWTILADSGAVLIGLFGRVILGEGMGDTERVLPLLSETLLHPIAVGVMIAIVLSAIMSTIDSLLVLAASAYVRDYHQQIKHPTTPDESLISLSRLMTIVLAFVALAVVLIFIEGPETKVFWFVIFGWSGIAATFVPTMILSLFWSKFGERGALVAMLVGFFSVPFYSFVAPHLPVVGPYIKKLSELPPAVATSFLAGILITLISPTAPENVKKAHADLTYSISNLKDET